VAPHPESRPPRPEKRSNLGGLHAPGARIDRLSGSAPPTPAQYNLPSTSATPTRHKLSVVKGRGHLRLGMWLRLAPQLG
jgi:hypothetical protein